MIINDITLQIIQSISIIISSIVVIYGINSWRREAKWKKKYELAEQTLTLFYEIQDIFKIIRNPMSYNNEGLTRPKSKDEDPDDFEIKNQAYIPFERYEKHKDSFTKLKTLKFKFMSVFGKDTGEYFDGVTKLINKILLASNFLGNRYWREQGIKTMSEKYFNNHLKNMEKYESWIWENYSEKDEINIELNLIIEKIENICRKIIEK